MNFVNKHILMEPKPIVELHIQILGILLMNSYEIKICLEATFRHVCELQCHAGIRT